MATDRRVTFLLGANIKNFTKGLNKAQRTFRNFGRDMERMGRTLTAGLTLPIVGAGTVAVKTAAEYETLRQSMDILNGSVEEGARNFERLKRFSARTPFQLNDLAKAQNMLQGFGQSADDAFESLSMIGDIAAVSGGDIQGIGIAFGQAAAEGRVMTRDIRQFINQGVPMIKMLADTMGVAQSEILDLASDGKISFEILQRAFREATSEGGMFADGMEKQSKTLAGLFSTLRDNVSIGLGELGEVISDTFNLKEVLENVTTGVQTIVQSFKDMSEDSRVQMLKIAGLFAVTGPVAFAIGKFVQMLAGLLRFASKIFPMLAGIVRKNFLVVTGAFIAAVAIGQALVDIWNTLAMNGKNFFISLEDSAKRGLSNVMSAVSSLVDEAFGAVSDAVVDMTGLNSALAEFWKNFEENTKSARKETERMGQAVRNASMDLIRFIRLQKQVDPTQTKKPKPNGEVPQGSLQRAVRQPVQEMSESVRLALGLVPGQAGEATDGVDEMSGALQVANSIANDFTQSFGQGMTNLIIQGRRFVDVLSNIGKLLASSILQTGIRLFLTGGLSGTGFFGSGGGLFGKIFGVNDALITSGGDVVQFHPDDNILAMKDFSGFTGGGPGKQEIRLFIDGREVGLALENIDYGRGR